MMMMMMKAPTLRHKQVLPQHFYQYWRLRRYQETSFQGRRSSPRVQGLSSPMTMYMPSTAGRFPVVYIYTHIYTPARLLSFALLDRR